MPYIDMKIRKVSDAATALNSLRETLLRAANFADLIIAENTFRVPVAELYRLAGTYRGLDQHLTKMACRLENRDRPMCKKDGKNLEDLLRDPNLNFYKAANSLQGAFAAYNSRKSSTNRTRVLSSIMREVPGFQTSAHEADVVVSRIKGIIELYTEDGHASHYAPLSDSSSMHGYSDANTNVAQVGSRASQQSSRRRSSAPRGNRHVDDDNWSTVAVHGTRSHDRTATLNRHHYTDKENRRPEAHTPHYMHGSNRSRRNSRR